MHRIGSIAVITALVCVISAPASAAWVRFTAHLTGAAEAPPNASPGIGFAVIDFDTVAHTMRLQTSFSDLTANVTVAHIHFCTTGTPFSCTGGVATTTPTFPGFPAGATSGSYDRIFDMTLASSYNATFITAQGSIAAAEAALLNGALTGRDYLNIHTSAFPGGEIRGFLVQAPEPMTLSLFGAGLVAAGLARRRLRKMAV